jgi:hypothetical protein
MPPQKPRRAKARGGSSLRFEGAKTDGLFGALDAVAWLKTPDVSEVAQFAGIDPRTAGKLLKNCVTIGLLDIINGQRYTIALAYPHKGSTEQKRAVVREALVRMPLLESVRQFLQLGEPLEAALRKSATVHRVENFEPQALSPLLEWAKQFDALTPGVHVEDLLDKAVEAKEQRHHADSKKRVVFLSHSSEDKPFVRKLATDLTAAGITVWLDEQNIRVGESIPERIAQGLAESDYFLIAVSDNSLRSEWVKRELNNALVTEIARRKTSILPVRLTKVQMPDAIRDKKYADFTTSYNDGLQELLAAMKPLPEHSND